MAYYVGLQSACHARPIVARMATPGDGGSTMTVLYLLGMLMLALRDRSYLCLHARFFTLAQAS